MGKEAERTNFRFGWIFWLMMVLMLVNVVFLARAVQILVFPGELDEVEMARRGAYALADFYRNEASIRNLEKNPAVRDSLARFNYEITQALSRRDIGAIVDKYGLMIRTVLEQEEENLVRQELIDLVNQDSSMRKTEKSGIITIRAEESGGIVIDDPTEILSDETKQKLTADDRVEKLTGVMEIKIDNGRAMEVTTRSMAGQLAALRQESQQLKTLLAEIRQKSGFAGMSGPGIVIEATLSQNGNDADITLGYDVRDMVNELFAAGAQGIEISGQRLVATSSIRIAAGRLLVNGRIVSTNPLVIKAVGDSVVLASSLDLIKNAPYFGLRLSIKQEDNVTLMAYQPSA